MTTFPDPNSIVDTLKSQGIDSSFANRAKLAGERGIDNYTGTAEQNITLNKYYQSNTGKTVVQDTSVQRGNDAQTGAKIDEKAGIATGTTTGQPTDTTNTATVTTNQATQVTGSDGKVYNTTAPGGYSYTLPPLEGGKKYVYAPDGRPMVQDPNTGEITNDPTADAEYEKNKENIARQAEYNAVFDSYKSGLDATHQALIDAIKQQAEQQKAKMEVLNKRMLGAKTVQGYRTRTAEYASEINTGILKAEEEEGLARLAEIDGNMRLAIAQAMSAKNGKDFETATKRLALIDELQKQKEETIQNIYKAYIDNAKLIADRQKALDTEERAIRDQSLQELAVMAPELLNQYDSLSTADKETWLGIMEKKTGLDRNILLGQMEKSRLEKEDKASLIANRKKTGTADTSGDLSYTNTELKKLRGAGIDPTNTKMADAYLYKGIKPEEYASTVPKLDPTKLNFNFGLNLEDQQNKVDAINEALVAGYTIEQIGEFMGFSKSIIDAFKKAITKSNNELL